MRYFMTNESEKKLFVQLQEGADVLVSPQRHASPCYVSSALIIHPKGQFVDRFRVSFELHKSYELVRTGSLWPGDIVFFDEQMHYVNYRDPSINSVSVDFHGLRDGIVRRLGFFSREDPSWFSIRFVLLGQINIQPL